MPKKSNRKVKIVAPKTKKQNGFFSRFKFTESYSNLILGAIVILIVGILILTFGRLNRNAQTSSANDINQAEDSQTSSTYTIKPGDDLWTISLNVYDNGYKWTEIAKANKLENPGLIHAGNKLVIPSIATEKQTTTSTTIAPATSAYTNNDPITGDTYKIVSGDNLWNICIRAYGDGYRWPEIARINNLQNPDLIFSGNTLKLPR